MFVIKNNKRTAILISVFMLTLVLITALVFLSGCGKQTENSDRNYKLIVQNYKKGTDDDVIKLITSRYIDRINDTSDSKSHAALYDEYKSLVNFYEGKVNSTKIRYNEITDELKRVESEKLFSEFLREKISLYLESQEELAFALEEIIYVCNESTSCLAVKTELFDSLLSTYKLNLEDIKKLLSEWLSENYEKLSIFADNENKEYYNKINKAVFYLNDAIGLIDEAEGTVIETKSLIKSAGCLKEKNLLLHEKVSFLNLTSKDILNLAGQAVGEIDSLYIQKLTNVQKTKGSFEDVIISPLTKKLHDELQNTLQSLSASEIKALITKSFTEIDSIISEFEVDIAFVCSPCDTELEEPSKNSLNLTELLTKEAVKINSAIRIIKNEEKINLSEVIKTIKDLNKAFAASDLANIENKIKSLNNKSDEILGDYVKEFNIINTYVTKGEYTDENGKKHKETAPYEVILNYQSELKNSKFMFLSVELGQINERIAKTLTFLKYCTSIEEAKSVIAELETYMQGVVTLYDKAFEAYLEIPKPILYKEKLLALESSINLCELRAAELGLSGEFVHSVLNEYKSEGKCYKIYDDYLEFRDRYELISIYNKSPKKAELIVAIKAIPNTPVTLATHRAAMEQIEAVYLDFLNVVAGKTLTQAEIEAVLGKDNAQKLFSSLSRYNRLCDAENAAKAIIHTISKFNGNVTLALESNIMAARAAVNNWLVTYEIGLEPDAYDINFGIITNEADLVLAEQRLAVLYSAKKAANGIISAISDIGEVVPTVQGESIIAAAELLYEQWLFDFDITKDSSVAMQNALIVSNRNLLIAARTRYNVLVTKGKDAADKIFDEMTELFKPDGNGGFTGITAASKEEIDSFRQRIISWIGSYSKNNVSNPAYMLIERADKLFNEVNAHYNDLVGGIYYAMEKITTAATQIKTDVMNNQSKGILYDIKAIESAEAAILSFEQKHMGLDELENSELEAQEQAKLLEAAELIVRARGIYNAVYTESKLNVYLFDNGLAYLETNVGCFANLKLQKAQLESIQNAYFNWLLTYFPDFAKKKHQGEIIGYGEAEIDSSYPTMSEINALVKYVAYDGEYTPNKLADFLSDAYNNSEYGIVKIEAALNNYNISGKITDKWEVIAGINYLKREWMQRFLGQEIGNGDGMISEMQIADIDTLASENISITAIIAAIKTTGKNQNGEVDYENGYNGGVYLFNSVNDEYCAVVSEIELMYSIARDFEQNYYSSAGDVSIYSDIPNGFDFPEMDCDFLPLSQIQLEFQRLLDTINLTDIIKKNINDTSLNNEINYINGVNEWGINIENMILRSNSLKAQKELETQALLELLDCFDRQMPKSEIEAVMTAYTEWLNGLNAPSGVDESSYRIIYAFSNGGLSKNQMYHASEIYEKIKEIEQMLETSNLDKVIFCIDNLYDSCVISIHIEHRSQLSPTYEHPELAAIDAQIAEYMLNIFDITNYYKLLELKERYGYLKSLVDEIYALFYEIISEQNPVPSETEEKYSRLYALIDDFVVENNNDTGGFFEDIPAN